MKTTWKDIPPVPTHQEFIDIVLSRTQRRLPTQIRAGFKIHRIRGFYIRKVKYTQETFSEKLGAILESFPRLDDIHPFHKDLLNTLYDADHFKIALGQLSTAKHQIEAISRDYVRLLKYGQSLFQCKNLKKAALGRMATITKRLKDSLLYLDQVRQHLGRLPSIDPNTRTLLICGYPNVGKSSFLRSVTRADVDVQPYAFTTKSLFVGHFDYKYLPFQVIDTPGILDHPLEEMNTIEMQSITAIAHIRSAILYFMDLSEMCGYSVQAQMQLFKSIKPLFANKVVFVVINKIDVKRPEDLDDETKAELNTLLQSDNVRMLSLSCTTQEGVQEVKNHACEAIITDRVNRKLQTGMNSAQGVGGRLEGVMRRIHVAMPPGGQLLEPCIPEAAKNRKKWNKDDPERPKTDRDIEEENGGAGVYNIDLRKDYLLKNPDWKYDKMVEIFEGKNVADYLDPDIAAKLDMLEEEEARLEAEGYYNEEDDDDIDSEEEADVLAKAEIIKERHARIRAEARTRKSMNSSQLPRKLRKRPLSKLENALDELGVDTVEMNLRGRSTVRDKRGRSLTRSRAASEAGDTLGMNDVDAMDVDPTPRERLRSQSRARSQPATNRLVDGVRNVELRSKAERKAKLNQRKLNRMARQGEADRHTTASLPKHLFSGKRGIGKTQRR